MSKRLEELEAMMPHGRIPKGLLDYIRDVYNEDEDAELAGKIAIAAIEYSLTGTTSFDEEKDVIRALRPYKEGMQQNLDNYNFTCEETLINGEYEKIAEMYWGQHMTQTAIAKALGGDMKQQTVSKRLKQIQHNYPELFKKYHPD